MAHRFSKHYTVVEARTLLPHVRVWLVELRHLRSGLARRDDYLASLLAQHRDLGGSRVESWVRDFVRFRTLIGEFNSREIQIKDLDRGLIDFPALRGTREVFLCWQEGEEDITFWHDIDAGFAGREPL